jgi:predicted DNA-binding protein (MmcQ/YjbR family)
MIKLEDLRKYCSLKNGVKEDFPFDLSILTFKVCDKIFLLTDINSEELSINLKCRPEHALHLRALYPQVTPGYHMNKKHWNTILIDGQIPDSEIYLMIDESYELVLSGVKKSLRDMIK